MELEKIVSKIQKLKAMSKMVGPEAENAKRLIDKLIEKYQLNPEEFSEEKKTYNLKAHRLKKYAIHLARFCKVPCYVLRGQADYIQLKLNSLEYRMYYELYGELKHQFNKKENEFKNQYSLDLTAKNTALKSFMMGYMSSNFPFERNICQECWEGHIVNYRCDKCGTQYGKAGYRNFGINRDAYEAGRNTNTKCINQSKLMIGSSV